MKLQLLKLGEDRERFLQLCRICRLRWLRSLSSLRSGTLLGDRLLLLGRLGLAAPLGGCSAIFCNVLVLVMLLLNDFLGVRDVSWISHQFIDGFQRPIGRISQMRPTRSLLRLAAFRAVKENPERKVVAEVFKTMLHSRWDKQEIVRPKLPTLVGAEKIARTADNNIDFVTRVRSLRIATARRVKFHCKCPVLEQRDGTFPLRLR